MSGAVYDFTTSNDGFLGNGVISLTNETGNMVQRFNTNIPAITKNLSINSAIYPYFSMKLTAINFQGNQTGKLTVTANQVSNYFFSFQTGTDLIRITLTNTTGTITSIQISCPSDTLSSAVLNTTTKFPWVAITNDSLFRGAPPSRLDPDNPDNATKLYYPIDDRDVPTLPNWCLTAGDPDYGFGCCFNSSGNLLAGSYNGPVYQIAKDADNDISLFSTVTTAYTLLGALIALLWTPNGLIYSNFGTNKVYKQSDGSILFGADGLGVSPHQVNYNSATQEYYVAWLGYNSGNGRIQKRTNLGVISDVATDLILPIGVTEDAYYVTHTLTDPRDAMGMLGTVMDDYVGGISSNGGLYTPSKALSGGTTIDTIWRARGVNKVSTNLYVTAEEANAWDQGNSGRIILMNSLTGVPTIYSTGIDYPQFPIVSGSRFYFQCPRDQKVGYFDTTFNFTQISSGNGNILMNIANGTWTPSPSGTTEMFTLFNPSNPAESVNLIGAFSRSITNAAQYKNKVHGWLRVPDTFFPTINKNPLPGLSDGTYTVPIISLVSFTGTLKAVVIPHRRHSNPPRWPGNPNPLFNEQPDYYLVFYQYKPS